jgi:hypothetical protein
MNAKETLKKIAEALNIVDEQPVVEETVEQPVAEAQAEQPVADEKPEVEAEQPVAEEPAAEEPVAEEQPEAKDEPVENSEVELLKKQLDDMKEILKNALAEPAVPEIPTKEPEGLTHSPEAQVQQKAKGIGRKGDDIMSRVFKYMNNN